MTDAERAALVETGKEALEAAWDCDEDDDARLAVYVRAILATIEPAIRADERARVVAEAVARIKSLYPAGWMDDATTRAGYAIGIEHSLAAVRHAAASRAGESSQKQRLETASCVEASASMSGSEGKP